nr:PREDICTED: nuclear receptor coactivator 5-like isoform X3 [Megachile rotundata]
MSRQLRVERDHVSRCDLRDLRDLRDIRDLRDLRDLRDVRDVRDDRERHGSGRHHRDEYLDYDHHPTAASTSALTNNPSGIRSERRIDAIDTGNGVIECVK